MPRARTETPSFLINVWDDVLTDPGERHRPFFHAAMLIPENEVLRLDFTRTLLAITTITLAEQSDTKISPDARAVMMKATPLQKFHDDPEFANRAHRGRASGWILEQAIGRLLGNDSGASMAAIFADAATIWPRSPKTIQHAWLTYKPVAAYWTILNEMIASGEVQEPFPCEGSFLPEYLRRVKVIEAKAAAIATRGSPQSGAIIKPDEFARLPDAIEPELARRAGKHASG